MESIDERQPSGDVNDVEWCFGVPSDRGIVEIRIRSNGEVVLMGGPDPVKWVSMEVTLPTDEFKPVHVVRNDM